MRLTLGVMRQEEGGRRHPSGRVSLFALSGAALLALVLFSWVPLVQAHAGANQLRATPVMEGKRMSILVPSQSPTATSAATLTPTPTSAATPTPTSAPAATPGATATTATGSSGTNSSNNLPIWLLVGLLVLIILSLLANAARQRSYRRPPPDIP